MLVRVLVLFRFLSKGESLDEASGHGGGDPPGPIPNPEVKPSIADGTAAQGRGRAGHCWPHQRALFLLAEMCQSLG